VKILFDVIVLLVDKQRVFPKLTQIKAKQGMQPTFAEVRKRHSILRVLFPPTLMQPQQPYLGN